MGREENILLGCVVYTKIKEKNQGEGQSENVWECCCEIWNGEFTVSPDEEHDCRLRGTQSNTVEHDDVHRTLMGYTSTERIVR